MLTSRGTRSRSAVCVAGFCALTVFVLVYRDLFVPNARETEVWLGFELTGNLARITAPLHWGIFGVGAWAFWTQRSWAWTSGALYALYIAFSHLVWNLISPSGGGWAAGLWQLALFSVPAMILLWLRPRPA